MKHPKSLQNLIRELAKLPGIGEKTAQRLALHLLKGHREDVRALSRALAEMADKARFCPTCFAPTDEDSCPICSDPERDQSVICVVEEPGDLMAVERTGEYHGAYHVLMGALAPLEGVGPDELKVAELCARVETEGVKEVIIASNPNLAGEATATYLAKVLRPLGVKITRIAHGLPMGGAIEYADDFTLTKSLKGRHEF